LEAIIEKICVDDRKYPVRAFVVLTAGITITSKGKGKTASLAVFNAIEKVRKERGISMSACTGCRYLAQGGCEHPNIYDKWFMSIPLSKCYELKGEIYNEREDE
jgi:hypothetical protein